MHITFHCNTSQPHQVEHGRWLKKGFKCHGLNLNITADITKEADIHIVSGPHYALDYWKDHQRVILLDRALWHQEKPEKWRSMDWLSAGWVKNGQRVFRVGCGRKHPKPKAGSNGRGSIFLADYYGPVEQADTIRLHPQRDTNPEPLLDCLHRHARAIGYNTTALITAGLEGLEIECKSPDSIMSHSNWLELLAYTDWKYSEIQSGALWQHLRQ